MDESYHANPVGEHIIHDSVPTEEDLADSWVAKLRHDAAALGKLCKRPRGLDDCAAEAGGSF